MGQTIKNLSQPISSTSKGLCSSYFEIHVHRNSVYKKGKVHESCDSTVWVIMRYIHRNNKSVNNIYLQLIILS